MPLNILILICGMHWTSRKIWVHSKRLSDLPRKKVYIRLCNGLQSWNFCVEYTPREYKKKTFQLSLKNNFRINNLQYNIFSIKKAIGFVKPSSFTLQNLLFGVSQCKIAISRITCEIFFDGNCWIRQSCLLRLFIFIGQRSFSFFVISTLKERSPMAGFWGLW